VKLKCNQQIKQWRMLQMKWPQGWQYNGFTHR
jgi:hypothetical protein